MRWYNSIKTASPAAYSPRHVPVTTQVPAKRADRFFQFLKKTGISHRFYHGTSSAVFGKTLDDNRILAQKALTNRVTKWAEPRTYGTDQVFYTAAKSYASGYAQRQGKLTKSSSIVLELDVPLYAITEIRHSIYNPYDTSGPNSSGSGHVSPQGVYNESRHHDNVTEIIQPQLAAIKSRKDEQKVFNQIITSIKAFLKQRAGSGGIDEWTTWYALDTRHVKQINLEKNNSKYIGPSLGVSSITELEKKLQSGTDEEKDALKVLLRKQIARYPGDLAILSPANRSSPTLLKAAAKGWARNLKGKKSEDGPESINGIEQIQFMPDVFLTDSFYRKGPKGKVTDEAEPVKEIVLGKLCKHCKGTGLEPVGGDIMSGDKKCTVCKGAKRAGGFVNVTAQKINAAESLTRKNNKDGVTEILKKIPSQLMSDARILPALKTKLQEQGVKEPLAALRLMEKLPHIVSGDTDLLSQITASLGDMPASHIIAEWNEMPKHIKNMPDVIEKYLTNQNPNSIRYSDFPEEVIAKYADIIAEKLAKGLSGYDFSNTMYYMEKIPSVIKEKPVVTKAMTTGAIKYATDSGLSYLFNYWPKFPQVVKDDPELTKHVVGMLEKTSATTYGIWERVPEEFHKIPQVAQKLNQYNINNGNLGEVKYELLDDALKAEYKAKVLASLSSNIGLYDEMPEEFKSDPKMIESVAKGVKYRIENQYISSPPDSIWNNPLFEQYKAGIIDAQFTAGAFGGIKYNELSPELKQKYIDSAAAKLGYGPTLYDELPPELKNNPTILKALAQGYVKNIQKGYGATVPDEVMNMPEFQPYKLDVEKAKLKSSPFYHINYDTLSDELKPTYLETAIAHLSSDPGQWKSLPPNLKYTPDVFAALEKGYKHKLSYDGYCYINDELLELPEFKGHLKEIQKAQMKTNDIWKIPYEGLAIDMQAEWMKAAEEHLTDNPTYHEYVPDNMKGNPQLIQATIKGLKTQIENGYGLDIPSSLKKLPNYNEFGGEVKALEKDDTLKKLKSTSSYDPGYKKYYNLSPDLVNDPDVVATMEQVLSTGGFSVSANSMKSAKGYIRPYITQAPGITPENLAKLDAALDKGLFIWVKNRLIYNPGIYPDMPQEEKDMPEVQEVFAEALSTKVKGTTDIYYLGSYYQYTKYLSPDKAKPVQDVIANKYVEKINAINDEYAKQEWCANAANLMADYPELKEACKPNVNLWINKIDNAYSVPNKAQYYQEASKVFPNDAKLLAKKDEIIQDYVNKMNAAAATGKEDWLESAEYYGFGQEPAILAAYKPSVDTMIQNINKEHSLPTKLHYFNEANKKFSKDPKLEPIKKDLVQKIVDEITKSKSQFAKDDWHATAEMYGFKNIPEIEEAYKPKPKTVDSYIDQIATATKKKQFELFEEAQKAFPNDPKLAPIKQELVDFVVEKINGTTSQEHKQIMYDNAMEYPSFKNVPAIEEALHPKPKAIAPQPTVQPVAQPAAQIDPAMQAKINKIQAMPELYDKANACTMALKSNPNDPALLALKETLVDQFVAKINSAFTPTAKNTVCHYAKVYLGAHAKIDQVCSAKPKV